MPLQLVRRGGRFFQNISVNGVFARPIRVIVPQSHTKRISFVAHRPIPTPVTPRLPRSSLIVKDLTRSYASRGRPKGSKTSELAKAKKSKPTKRKSGKKRKEPTERQKELQKAKEKRDLVRDLKDAALEPPKALPTIARVIAIGRRMIEMRGQSKSATEALKEASDYFRSLNAEERQHYHDLANANKTANAAAYEAWLKSHTPRQILEANLARRKLAKIKGKKLILLHDDRVVKRPRVPFIMYMQEMRRVEDPRPESATEQLQRYAGEWREMSDAEKEKYIQMTRDDQERYEREHIEVYGFPPHQTQKRK
ncbi:uncharacterized protein BJX67DRAFT_99092 [Aspergillus lucknowensis]|uniref:HMG box domain-containing protein n=1 Tax=Aspergillus lucknowensis TaxID=176173 RepID=A0ABR4M6C6_9EURO